LDYNGDMRDQQNGLRLAELMTSLSLAIDLGTGQPMEWVSRCCLLAVHLAERLGMSEQECQDVYYLMLLRHLGCTSNSVMDAHVFGSELGVAEFMSADMTNMPEVMRLLFRVIGRDAPPFERAQTLA